MVVTKLTPSNRESNLMEAWEAVDRIRLACSQAVRRLLKDEVRAKIQ